MMNDELLTTAEASKHLRHSTRWLRQADQSWHHPGDQGSTKTPDPDVPNRTLLSGASDKLTQEKPHPRNVCPDDAEWG